MTCAIDGCCRKVDPKWCLCSEHYRAIPDAMRAELALAYSPTRDRDEQGPGFHTALSRIDGWIRKTFGAEERKARPSWDQLVAYVRARDAARGMRTPDAVPRATKAITAAPDLEPQMKLL